MLDALVNSPILFVSQIIAVIVAISLHEFAHAYVADRLGDPTPSLQGRLTLNPRKHIDLMGLVFLLFFGFGWGKPVRFDPYNLKNPRRDAAFISLAGPTTNFTIALVSSILLRLLLLLKIPVLTSLGIFLFPTMIYLNILWGIFNLLPIHPLDGFHIVSGILTEKRAREWNQLARYGLIFLIALILPIGNKTMLETIIEPLANPLIGFLLP